MITLRLDDHEKAILWNALQDLIVIREGEGKENEVEDLWHVFNKLEKAANEGLQAPR